MSYENWKNKAQGFQTVDKPEWLKISIGANERYTETKRIVESHCLL